MTNQSIRVGCSTRITWLGVDGVEEYPRRFSSDGKLLAAIRNQDARLSAVLYDIATWQSRIVPTEPGATFNLAFVLGGRKLLSISSTPTRAMRLNLFDIATRSQEEILPPDLEGTLGPAGPVTPEHVWIESDDGIQVPLILYRPHKVFEASGPRLPAVIMLHGGPTGQWFCGWDPLAQFLVSRNYVVAQPNVRGSTGYGAAFRNMSLMDWGGGDLLDVVATAEYLRGIPAVDPNRVSLFGDSYGGYLAYMAAVKYPQLWRAVIAWKGITDLYRLYQEVLPQYRDYLIEQMGDPAENRQLWRDRSPINFASNLKSRLLIIHGVNDTRCPVSQARLFRQRLVESGLSEGSDFFYIELEGEGHGSENAEHKRTFYRTIDQFLTSNA